MRHPNRPVVNIGIFEAMAYCYWRTGRQKDGRIVRLPVESEMARFYNAPAAKDLFSSLKDVRGRRVPDLDKEACNWRGAGLNRPSPVGAFPLRIFGACDILGNVWEFQLPIKSLDGVRSEDPGAPFPVAGGAYDSVVSPVAYPPSELAIDGYASIGFRCVLSAPGLDPASYLMEVMELPYRPRKGGAK